MLFGGGDEFGEEGPDAGLGEVEELAGPIWWAEGEFVGHWFGLGVEEPGAEEDGAA